MSADNYPPPGAALVEELDRRLLLLLRDGRKVVGTLRSFDQFANLVLEESYERVVVGKQFADVPLGVYLVRGENLVLMGRVDEEGEREPAGLVRAPMDKVRAAAKAEREEARLKGTMRARMDFLDLE
jgi:U6 snRNA-associated Sm-like protein LSm1